MKDYQNNKIKLQLRNFFKDADGNVAIWQAPNIPLYGWFMFKVLAVVVAAGRLHSGFNLLSTALLFTWAYLEITSGVNYFRRLLGLIVITAIIVGYFRK